MSLGTSSASTTFQRIIHFIPWDLEGCKSSINEVIYSSTMDEHLMTKRGFFVRLLKANLTVNFDES